MKQACFQIWKPKHARVYLNEEFKPLFVRYIGQGYTEEEYNSILRTFYVRHDECPYSLFFDGRIPMESQTELVVYVGNELKGMDVTHMETADIVMFDDAVLNRIFLESLARVVNIALKQEVFPNNSVRDNFITKLILWAYLYVRPIAPNFTDSETPKCIFYGDIKDHEIYFLMLLYNMTFDVVYINPRSDCGWARIDSGHWSTLIREGNIGYVKSLEERIQNARELDGEESTTAYLSRKLEETTLTPTGIYKPWQFRKGNTRPVLLNSTIYDLNTGYLEPAKIREGFKVKGDTVYVPNYFFQIDGVYDNMAEYGALVTKLTNAPNTWVLQEGCTKLITKDIPVKEKYRIGFSRMRDGTYDIKALQTLPYYSWGRYHDSVEEYILKKITETLKSNLYKHQMTPKEEAIFIGDILGMNEEIVKMVDNFDYTSKVPKVVIFVEREGSIAERYLYLLGFIYTLGFDVVILCPAGMVSIDEVFNVGRFNSVRLDSMRYDLTLIDVTGTATDKAAKKVNKWFNMFFN